ncbi:DNA topoisomerase I, partial [Candidatus Woesearchaeota archaeon]|nr:DNA topoisomerase I [Candidatus Woesearchaeota archaeon]
MTELIITEKPSSAVKVAAALADKAPVKKKSKGGSYFEVIHNKKVIYITSAVGHLYGLVEVNKKGWTYPVFDIKWDASYKSHKDLKYVKGYIDTISMLAKKCDEFTVACDYDVEGEVIGLNVIKYACKKKDANRMKFSTLTKGDLVKSYENKLKHLDWGQAHAGETRHYLDWYYGINLSRALTAAVKSTGAFKVMSAGRVQGPALKLLVDREREIQAFVSEPFWLIRLDGDYNKQKVEALHKKDKIFDKKVMEEIMKKVKGEKEAKIAQIKRTKRNQAPPTPFNLTNLQSEAYNLFKITPKETLSHAQSLYLAGVTSYPRTSSQQLDPKLGFKKILTDLSRQMNYEGLCKELLKKGSLKPNNGKKTDPAHPAIYPTGQVPGELKEREQKIYDLVVKRFMATFAEPAVRETMEVSLDVKEEIFIAKGTRTVEENWHVFYKPYVKLEEITLPDLKENEVVNVKKIFKEDKETQPPNRFNQSSIIKELEKKSLGTKATRADILDRLFQRGYVEGVKIFVTKLGMETVAVLEKYAPTIVDENLTAEFEADMEKIRQGKEKQENVLEKAKKFLTKLLAEFKKKEKVIGKEILQSVKLQRVVKSKLRILGTDPKTGLQILVRIGKYGPLVQRGDKEKGEEVHFASLGNCDIDEVTLEQALELFKLPRKLGKTDEGEEIEANNGRFGPYVKYGQKYVS